VNIPILTSKDNPLVRTIRLAAAQARRCPPELVVAEGIRVLEEATKAGCLPEAVLIAEGFGDQPRERVLLDCWTGRSIPVRRATASILKGLSDVVSPQGAFALFRIPAITLPEVEERPDPLILCLCGIQDPGNLGTLLRTARAAGVSFVCSTAGTVSARNPKAIRASAGAFFRIPIVEELAAAAMCSYCRSRDILMYQADARAKRSCWTIDLSGPAAILLGNEARGLQPAEFQDIPALRVPMISDIESLNVAVAGAVLLFEARRQRSLGAGAAAIGS
jgi:RNA methyltransferase, TrmH family